METSQSTLDRDKHQLRLLKIFHYIAAGMCMVFGSIFIIHIIMGLIIYSNPEILTEPNTSTPQPSPPDWFGLVMAAMGSCAVSLNWAFGILIFVSGRKISQLRARTFSLAVAGISCLWMPFGTVLGVFTIILLLRGSVIRLYGDAATNPSPAVD